MACKMLPDVGEDLFIELVKAFGRKTAVEVWGISLNSKFREDFAGLLKYTEDGVPTAESLIDNPYIEQLTGKQKDYLSSKFLVRDNTVNGKKEALLDAMKFNRESQYKNKYIALLEESPDDIRVVVKPRTLENILTFNDLYGVSRLNNIIIELLASLGITIGELELAEIDAGRVGSISFSQVEKLAEDLIRIANNPEGLLALSEEFAHLIVRAKRNTPLIDRAFNSLKELDLKNYLGDEYDELLEFYNGNMDKVKEEVVGQILQECLLDYNMINNQKAPNLWQRIVKFIKGLFSNVDALYLNDSVNNVKSELYGLAKELIEGNKELTKEDIKIIDSKDEFNSLSTVTDHAIDFLRKKALSKESLRLKQTFNEKDKENIQGIVYHLQLGITGKIDAVTCMALYLLLVLKFLKRIDDNYNPNIQTTPEKKFAYLERVALQSEIYKDILDGMIKWYHEALTDDEFDIEGYKFGENEEYSFKDLIDKTRLYLNNILEHWTVEASPAFAKFVEPFLGVNLTNPFKKGEKIGTVEDMLAVADGDISFMDLWLDSMSDSLDVMLLLFDSAVRDKKENARLELIDLSKLIQILEKKAKRQGVDLTFMYKLNKLGKRTDRYISRTEAQALGLAYLEYYDGFMKIKELLDKDCDMSKVSGFKYRTILIRKEFIGGSLALLLSGDMEAFGLSIRDKWYAAADDDVEFGTGEFYTNEKGELVEKTVKAKKELALGIDGKPARLVPRYYINKIANQELVSDDPTGSLIAYAYMAKNYKALNEVRDAIETGTRVMKERKIRKTKDGISYLEDATSSNFLRKLEEWKESLLYGRYFADEAWMEGKFLNTNIEKKKLVDNIMSYTATLALGFNGLANLANVTNGIAMLNIDAVVGLYFDIKHLAAADAEYAKLLMPHLANFGKAIKDDELSLLSEMFNIKMDFLKNRKKAYDREYMRTIFGESAAFLLQEAGDHWLYMRTAIGMLKSMKITITENGNKKEVSLYDCLEVVDLGEGVKKMLFKPEYNISKEQLLKITRLILKVNQRLFGIYNLEDSNVAHRYAVGKALILFRKWMKPAYNARYAKARYDVLTDEWSEGYYRTVANFLVDACVGIKQGEFNLMANWDLLSPEQRRNIARAATELGLLLALKCLIIFNDFGGSDPKNRPWAKKFAEFAARRTYTEIAALTPTLAMPEEFLRILKSPMAAVTPLEDLISLIEAGFSVDGWTNEILTGVYKGWSPVGRNAFKMIPYGKNLAKYGSIESITNYYKLNLF